MAGSAAFLSACSSDNKPTGAAGHGGGGAGHAGGGAGHAAGGQSGAGVAGAAGGAAGAVTPGVAGAAGTGVAGAGGAAGGGGIGGSVGGAAGGPMLDTKQARGKYLVDAVIACGDCHTPQGPNGPDMTHYLAGNPSFITLPNGDALPSRNLTTTRPASRTGLTTRSR